MDRLLPFLITGVALLVGWIVFAAIRAQQHSRRELLDAARDLGFTPADTSPEFLARLADLYARPSPGAKQPALKSYKTGDVFRRRLPEGEMFIFDLVDTSGDQNNRTEKQAVAVVSPRLDLPRFVLLPRIGAGSAFAPVVSRVLSWLARHYGNPVEFPHVPEFAQHYLVSSPDPEGTRRFLTPDRLHRMAEIRNMGMHAGRDMFTLTHYDLAGRVPARQRLRERVDHATRILSAFGA